MRRGWVASLAVALALGVSPAPADMSKGVLLDRVAVRYVASETGGASKPRFISERELMFFARVEAASEAHDLVQKTTTERFVRNAIERLVSEDMLASLNLSRGIEPLDLPQLTGEARAELELRVGGTQNLLSMMHEDGLDDAELTFVLRRRMRAAAYVDRAMHPILHPSEEELREAFRTSLHPFRSWKLEDVRTEFSRWLVQERLRIAELEFFQSTQNRTRISMVLPKDAR